jgi:hypothetical protein
MGAMICLSIDVPIIVADIGVFATPHISLRYQNKDMALPIRAAEGNHLEGHPKFCTFAAFMFGHRFWSQAGHPGNESTLCTQFAQKARDLPSKWASVRTPFWQYGLKPLSRMMAALIFSNLVD